MYKFLFTLLTISLFSIGNMNAQENRAPSPSAKLVQKVGLTDVTIEYSRPGVKGRTIFAADGLVPFGKKWRTGANAATKITFSDDVKIDGNDVPAGSYAIVTTPDKDSWAIHFFPYESTRWSTYGNAEPMLTINAVPQMLSNSTESFLITVDELRDYSAKVVMQWEKTMVAFPITVM